MTPDAGRVLVTGASGFVGSALAAGLVEKGYRVRVLLRKTSTTDLLSGIMDQVEVVYGDVTKRKDVEEAVRECDYVCNVAGVVGHGIPAELLWDVNAKAAGTVAKACAKAQVKQLVHLSTAYAIGRPRDVPADEDSPMHPYSEYEKSKADGEKRVLRASGPNLNVTILRPPPVYGPGDTRNLLKVFRTVRRGAFPLIGSGGNAYHTVYVGNLVDAFCLVLGNRKAYGETFFVADELTTLKEFLLAAAKAMDVRLRLISFPTLLMRAAAEFFELFSFTSLPMPMTRTRLSIMTDDYEYSTERIRALGWMPRLGLKDAMEETVSWYEEKGLI